MNPLTECPKCARHHAGPCTLIHTVACGLCGDHVPVGADGTAPCAPCGIVTMSGIQPDRLTELWTLADLERMWAMPAKEVQCE
jgi:hypothetical protein